VIYARVSSKEQEKEGFSIPAQLKFEGGGEAAVPIGASEPSGETEGVVLIPSSVFRPKLRFHKARMEEIRAKLSAKSALAVAISYNAGWR
jgi:hypothetical protein